MNLVLPVSNSQVEWRRGWPVVLAAAIGYGTGGAMLILLGGLFIKPMRDALGWSTAAVTIMPIVSVIWALSNPFIGAIIDRFGSRIIAIVGMIGFALCFTVLAILPVSRVGLYGSAGLMGIFASMTSVGTYTRGVASYFRQNRGLAFGVALSGSAVVAIIATPLIGSTIAHFGWRAGYLALSAVILIVALPAVLLFYRERVDGKAAFQPAIEAEGASLSSAIHDVRFWCYALSFTLACIAVSGTAAHLQPLLASKGFPLYTALSLGATYPIAIGLGKLLGGFLLDRIWPFGVVVGICMMASAGSFGLAFVMSATALPLVVLIIGAIGVATGAEADFVGYFGLRSFGLRKFSTIMGILAMIITLGTAFGGWLYGHLFDLYGSYDVACLVGGACLLASALVAVIAGLVEVRVGKESAGWIPATDSFGTIGQ